MKKITPPFWKAPGNYDPAEESDRTASRPAGESLTIHSQAEDTDINVIVRRFGITGHLPENPRLPMYGDFTEITDYRSAWTAVENAQKHFMEIPAEIRSRFNNDPQELLEFTANPANLETLREWGLAKPKAPGEAIAPSPLPNPPPAGQGGKTT